MKNVALFTFFLLLPFFGIAQNCVYPFSSSCWFSLVSLVRISPDGSKFLATGGSGPSANSNATTTCGVTSTSTKVYDVSASGIVYNSGMSSAAGLNLVSYFTQNNGYFYSINTSGASYSINFRSSTGASFNLGTFNIPAFNKIEGAPNKMMARNGATNQFIILDATNPAAPTATTVTLPGTAPSGSYFGGSQITFAASQTDDRIYYMVTESGSATAAPYYRYKIKAATFAGVAAPGWTDVVVQRGLITNMGIRPTDRRIFARMGGNAHPQHLPFHGIIAFDKNGALSTDLNMTDLSIMGGWQQGLDELDFDAEGNIYANRWNHGNPAQGFNSFGLMKFDPKGNLDMVFLRNAWNSYGESYAISAGSFDITSSGLLIKCTAGAAYAYTDSYALDMNHVNTNNEDPTVSTYSSLPTSIASWGTYPEFNNGPLSKYINVQFLFNNGKLVRPDMTQTAIDGNCGISGTTGAGVIDCTKTAFISAPKQGTPSKIVIRVTINVTTIGSFFPIEVSGSGFSLADTGYKLNATSTGVQNFFIPVVYDGSPLTSVVITAGQAGSCNAVLSGLPNDTKKVMLDVWTPEHCTFIMAGPTLR
jgi:hypothetical protein